MGRIIAGVIVGYLVMFVLVFGLFTGAWFMLGAERSFQPGTYEVSPAWIGMSIAVGLLAAMGGGAVCGLVSGRQPKAGVALAAIVLVLGMAMAVPVLSAKDPGPRADDVSMQDAMMKAQQPVWIAFLNPFIGAVGVLIGARMIGCCGGRGSCADGGSAVG